MITRREIHRHGATFAVEGEGGVVVALCHGDDDAKAFPDVEEAREAAARLDAVLAGEPLPAGWTVQRTPAGFFVRDGRRRIVGHRHPGDYPGDTATPADCLRLATRLDTPVRRNPGDPRP